MSKHNPERNNRFVFIEETTAPAQERKVLVRRKSGSLLPPPYGQAVAMLPEPSVQRFHR